MSNIQQWLESVVSSNAQEILINASQPLRLKRGREWLLVDKSDSRQLIAQILTDEEKKNLYENLQLRGSREVGGISFQFDLQVDFEGVVGSLRLKNPTWAHWVLPSLFIESTAKPYGLHLVVGPRRSGKTTFVCDLLQGIKARDKVIAVYSDEEGRDFASPGNMVSQFSISQLRQNGVLKSADIVVLDTLSMDLCATALQLAEEGRNVVMTLPYWNVRIGMRRFVDALPGDLQSRLQRIAETVQMSVGCRLLAGIESPTQGAFEMLVVDSDVQKMILAEKFDAFEQTMGDLAEKNGSRSMNQSLFQLLVKRKIEFKTAFENSPSPDQLDSLLKKVGV
ncbi:MAG: hypothetical protein COT73_06850 [Bdellovibrio sp. CG10_big_fil_rev_8_21_14_0_10_47_8]|nr:MAG: hypothetical protein COT73_06850 [Bdellovibrio sp. CG10_big_fil_rev_8_21_14_0_10_47_8]